MDRWVLSLRARVRCDRAVVDDLFLLEGGAHAVRRGERYMMDATRLNRGHNEDMYADAYRLLH